MLTPEELVRIAQSAIDEHIGAARDGYFHKGVAEQAKRHLKESIEGLAGSSGGLNADAVRQAAQKHLHKLNDWEGRVLRDPDPAGARRAISTGNMHHELKTNLAATSVEPYQPMFPRKPVVPTPAVETIAAEAEKPKGWFSRLFSRNKPKPVVAAASAPVVTPTVEPLPAPVIAETVTPSVSKPVYREAPSYFDGMADVINGDIPVRTEPEVKIAAESMGKPLPEVLGEPIPVSPKKISNPEFAVLQTEGQAEAIAAKARMTTPVTPPAVPEATRVASSLETAANSGAKRKGFFSRLFSRSTSNTVAAPVADSLTAGLPQYRDIATEMARAQAELAPVAAAVEQAPKAGFWSRVKTVMTARIEDQGGALGWFGRRAEGALQVVEKAPGALASAGWTATRGLAYDIPKAGLSGLVEHGGNALSKTASALKSGAGHIHGGASNIMLAGAAGVAVLGLGAALSTPARAVVRVPKFDDEPNGLAFAGGNATIDVGGVAMPQLGMSQGQSSWMSRMPAQGSVEEQMLMNSNLPPSR